MLEHIGEKSHGTAEYLSVLSSRKSETPGKTTKLFRLGLLRNYFCVCDAINIIKYLIINQIIFYIMKFIKKLSL